MSRDTGSTSQPDQARVLDQLVQASAHLVQADYCAFYTCEGGQLQPAPIALHSALGDGAPDADQPRALARAAIDGAHPILVPEYRSGVLRSLLALPVGDGAHPHSALVAGALRPYAFDQADQVLLSTLAEQAAVAIENARLYESTTLRVRDLNLLYLVTRELSGSLTPERALNRTLVLMNRALHAHEGYILLQDTGHQHLVYRAMMSHTPPADGTAFRTPHMGDGIDYRRDTGLVGWLVSHQDSIRIGDIAGDAHLHLVPDQDRWHRSLLAAPLLIGNDIVGAIVFYHAEPDHFTLDHQRLFDAIAAQIAISASNAEMFRLLREAADRLGIMLRSQQLEAAKSQAILEGVADGVMVTDADGEITLFNAAAERILQIHRADIIGHSSAEVSGIFGLAGTSWTHVTDLWGKGTLQPDDRALYDEQLELDGRVVSMRVAPVVRQGTFEGTVSVFRDITKEVELDRMKSEFVSSVSHELRTPMTSIKGYIDLLHSGMAGSVTEGQRRFLQIIKTNADRLTLLVNDLLDISRIETGRLKLTIESVDPRYIVDLVLSSHTPDAARRQQTLINAIDAPLPPVRADPDRMTQVLTNLVSNAIYYTPAAGTITVSAEVTGDYLHIHVADTGIGIKEEDKTKLFSRFFRADTPLVQARSGTGLGLTIVKSIVELQGGEIWFDSTFGQGSTFTFSLPLADQAGLDAARREFRIMSYRQQDKRILLVEGEVEIADAIAQRLRTQGGYLVHIERSGRDALRYLARTDQSSDLILLDLDLPEMDGMDLLQRILGHGSLAAIPVLALSLSHDLDGARPANATAYVSRPVRTHRLLEAVNAVFAEKAEDLDRTAGSVMIAETDNQLAELFTMVLTQKGYTVDIERDLEALPQAAREGQPDMILLDVTQPDQGGFDILRSLKESADTRNIPVLVVTNTALDMQAQRQQDLDVNALEFVDGPVEVHDLFAEIKHVLDEAEGDDDEA